MSRHSIVTVLLAMTFSGAVAADAAAQETVKVGLILPMTGQQASTGKQIAAAAQLYIQEHDPVIAGKKI